MCIYIYTIYVRKTLRGRAKGKDRCAKRWGMNAGRELLRDLKARERESVCVSVCVCVCVRERERERERASERERDFCTFMKVDR